MVSASSEAPLIRRRSLVGRDDGGFFVFFLMANRVLLKTLLVLYLINAGVQVQEYKHPALIRSVNPLPLLEDAQMVDRWPIGDDAVDEPALLNVLAHWTGEFGLLLGAW